jgi:deoxyribodipyrimidine photo-lyase
MHQGRVRVIKEGRRETGPVAYWMSRDQRMHDNWAFVYAQDMALGQQVPLIVVFCLVPQFCGATMRQYGFMIRGLEEVERSLIEKRVPFYLLLGPPEAQIPEFVRTHGIRTLVTDFDPLGVKRRWKRSVSQGIDIPFLEVDAHNIVPCWVASQKQEYGAYTIRPKIRRLLTEYLDEFPTPVPHPVPWDRRPAMTDWKEARRTVNAETKGPEIEWLQPGAKAALKALDDFIRDRLPSYEKHRNDPTKDGQSNLSPYLHFGQLSAQRVALEVLEGQTGSDSRNTFLEELIVRRELSDNFCYYNPLYDTFEGFPTWARETLNRHRSDERARLYSPDELEEARTHDPLWNAAQTEMVQRGKMHNYMRMYWAKKILEWSESPEEALAVAIHLNDKYELDGRDPNGYAGIAWAIGGVHDRPWRRRPIYGTIRYMSYNGCRSKFDIKAYMDSVKQLAALSGM